MLTNWRKSIDSSKAELKIHKKSEKGFRAQLADLEKAQDTLQQAREIFQKSAILTQNHLADHLSCIVTKAIRAVFYEKDVYFKVEFVERRNTTECDMWIQEGEFKYSLLESRGFGMTDIVSFALRVAYILLHTSDNVLIIDEPFRNLSKDKHEVASQMIKEISKELDMQFIISTHVDLLERYADKVFRVSQTDGVSKIY